MKRLVVTVESSFLASFAGLSELIDIRVKSVPKVSITNLAVSSVSPTVPGVVMQLFQYPCLFFFAGQNFAGRGSLLSPAEEYPIADQELCCPSPKPSKLLVTHFQWSPHRQQILSNYFQLLIPPMRFQHPTHLPP